MRAVVTLAMAWALAWMGCGTSDDPAGPQECSGCEQDEVCIFDTGECAPSCDPDEPSCPDGLECNACATSSCPLCEDCVPACVQASDDAGVDAGGGLQAR